MLDPPEITGQEDGNATVTALTRFAKCPREYYLGQYLKFGVRRKKWEEDGEQRTFRQRTRHPGSRLAGGHSRRGARSRKPSVWPRCSAKGPLARRLAQATRIEREFDFLLAVEDLVIRGQVDLWFEQGGEVCIVDYKTDNVTAAEAAQRAQDYALQLRLYGMAVEQVAGRPPSRACLHFLRPNTVVEVDLRPSLLDAPEQVVRDFQEAQSTLHFPLVEGPHCRRCQFYKALCPARDVTG